MPKILIVEDDKDAAKMVLDWLSSQHYTVDVLHDGLEGLNRLLEIPYDAVVLDWNLPSLSGPEICRRYRLKDGTAPVLILTGRNAISEKEQGFNAGADDYLTKPFHVKELAARLGALLRRPANLQNQILTARDIVLDSKMHEVKKNGQKVELLRVDFALLEFFLRHPNEVFTAEALTQRVWHTDKEVGSDAVRSSVRRLRQALDSNPEDSIIQNIHRVGYRLNRN